MLPTGYELPAAVALLLSGTIACFAGYRLFRTVLAIYGFILGSLIASSVVASSNVTGMLAAVLVGGVVGAVVLLVGYFVGIALAGAALGAMLTHLVWAPFMKAEPPAAAVVAISVVGAVAATFLQRYFVIVATAFVGAWTIVVGAMLAATVSTAGRAPRDAESWIFYPLHPALGRAWVPFAWVAIALLGATVQFGRKGKRK